MKRNPLSTKVWIAVGVAAVAAGAVAFVVYEKTKLPQVVSKSVSLVPGAMTLTGVGPGSSIAISVPGTGALTTLTVGGLPHQLDSASTATINNVISPGTATVTWVDDSLHPQSTSIAWGP